MKLGELNSYAQLVPNTDLLIQLHVTKEAMVSSRINGTQTNLNQAILPKEEVQSVWCDDLQEVNNYNRALSEAIAELKTLPISLRLLRQIHLTLLTQWA